MSDYSLSDLINRDADILALATYEVSKGLIPILDTEQKILDFSMEVIKTHNAFKKGIQIGEYDYEFLKNDIMLRNGAIKQEDRTIDKIVDNVIIGKQQDTLRNDTDAIINAITDVINVCKKNSGEIRKDNEDNNEIK